MIESAIRWLRQRWWGLVVAYAITVAAAYSLIWAVIDPLGVPDRFLTLWPSLYYRSTYHIAASLFIGANLAIVLELFVRKSHWHAGGSISDVPPFDKLYTVRDSKAFYDAIATEYDQRNSQSLLRTHEKVISSIKEVVASRANPFVLDLGGGTGKLIAHHFFDKPDIHWVYADESPHMVEEFRKNLDATRLKKTVEVEEIAKYLERPVDRQYDVVVLSLVLTSMQRNPDWAMIASRIAKDGRLIIAEIDAAYTATHPFYVVKSGDIRHALQPRPVPLTQLIHETEAANLTLDHTYPVTDGQIHYAFVAVFSKA